MSNLKTLTIPFLLICFFIVIFLLTSSDIKELDTFYHIKLGQIISQEGISNIDVLYHGDAHRIWMPFEWSFQMALYQFTHIFGISLIRYYVGIFATLQVVIIFFILKKILKVSTISALCICALYVILNYPSFTARPQLWAYLFFNTQLFIIFAYLFKNKNILFLSVPLIYVWSTFHITALFGPFLLLLFSFSCFCLYIYKKEKVWKKRSLVLLLWGFITIIISLLPPTGILQYKHILLLIQQHNLFSQLNELQPLTHFPLDFFIYVTICLIVCIPFFILVFHKPKLRLQSILLAPLSLFIFSAFFALRNVYYGHIALLLIAGWYLHHIETDTTKKIRNSIYIFIFFLGVTLLIILQLRLRNAPYYEPKQAVAFLKENIQAQPIFHIREYGGYFSYHLYPTYKIFIDGRVDASYIDRFPDYLKLVNAQYLSDDLFSQTLYELLDKYSIQTIVLTYKKNILGEKILKIIHNNTEWNLTFWDDSEVIFTKDKKNHPVTPFSSLPFIGDDTDSALRIYKDMDQTYPSALSKNSIGVILVQNQRFDEAEDYFRDAIAIDPSYLFSYINLSLLSLKEQNPKQAVAILQEGIPFVTNKSYLYLNIGKIYSSTHQKEKAIEVWRQGLWSAKTTEEQQQFQDLLEKE